jgi:hypothetical protein
MPKDFLLKTPQKYDGKDNYVKLFLEFGLANFIGCDRNGPI